MSDIDNIVIDHIRSKDFKTKNVGFQFYIVKKADALITYSMENFSLDEKPENLIINSLTTFDIVTDTLSPMLEEVSKEEGTFTIEVDEEGSMYLQIELPKIFSYQMYEDKDCYIVLRNNVFHEWRLIGSDEPIFPKFYERFMRLTYSNTNRIYNVDHATTTSFMETMIKS